MTCISSCSTINLELPRLNQTPSALVCGVLLPLTLLQIQRVSNPRGHVLSQDRGADLLSTASLMAPGSSTTPRAERVPFGSLLAGGKN